MKLHSGILALILFCTLHLVSRGQCDQTIATDEVQHRLSCVGAHTNPYNNSVALYNISEPFLVHRGHLLDYFTWTKPHFPHA